MKGGGEEVEEFTEKAAGKDSNIQELLTEIARRYTGKCFGQFMEIGIYPRQMPIMGLLKEHDGYSQSELAARMHVKPPTVTVTVHRLEKAGMVIRRPDKKDQRVTRIYLSEKGRQVMEKATQAVAEHEKILFGDFSEAELCLMRRFFLQILENIQKIPGPTMKEILRKEECS